jgi:hypothetical protein
LLLPRAPTFDAVGDLVGALAAEAQALDHYNHHLMPDSVLRHIFGADVSPGETWRLLEWCQAHAAEEFTLDVMGFQGELSPLSDAIEAALAPFARARVEREHLTALLGQAISRPTALWTLSEQSIGVLHQAFPDGLFTHPSCAPEGWCEDVIVYRAGRLMLGIVSHEQEGLLQLSSVEAAAFDQLGIPTRPKAEWI